MTRDDEPDGYPLDELPAGDRAELRRCVDEWLANAERVRAECYHALGGQVEALFDRAAAVAGDAYTDLGGQADKVLERAARLAERLWKPVRREAAELILSAARVAVDHGYQLVDLGSIATDLVMGTVPDLVPYANLAPDHDQPPGPPRPARPTETAAPEDSDDALATAVHAGRGADQRGGPVGVCADLNPFEVCPPGSGTRPHVIVAPPGVPVPGGTPCGTDPTTGQVAWVLCVPFTPPPTDGGPPANGAPGPPPQPPPEQAPCPPPPCQPVCPQEPAPKPPVTCDEVVVLGVEGSDRPPKPFDGDDWVCRPLECPDGKPRWACHKKECSTEDVVPAECPPPAEEAPVPELPPAGDAAVLCGANDWTNALAILGWNSDRAGCGPGAVGLLRDIEGLVSHFWNAVWRAIPSDWELTLFAVNELHKLSLHLAQWSVHLIDSGLCMSGCLTQSWTAQVWRIVFGFLEQWFGYVNVPVQRGLTYAENWCCPNVIPDVGQLLRMFQTNQLTGAEYLNAVRAHGVSITWAGKLLSAHHWRLTPDQVIDLWHRKVLNDGQRDELLHQIGVWDERERRAYTELGRWLLPPTDLIRLMVRDTFDPAIVAAERLFDEFDAKFGEDAQRRADAVGIDRSQLQLLWGAHWHYPSPTQLYAMLHRNRPGRVDGDLVVTMEDVLRVLAIDDVAPVWRARLASISYAVIRLVDLRRIYFEELIDHDELIERLQDRGYTRRDAELVAAYWRTQKAKSGACTLAKLKSSAGYKAYRDGHANKAGASRLIVLFTGCDPAEHPELWEAADLERRANMVKRTAANVARSIAKGIMTPAEGTAILLGMGLELEQVLYHQQLWRLPDPRRPKEASISEHCEWVERGIETPAEMYQALLRMGYPPVTAERILGNCGYEITQHAQTAAERAERKRLAAEHKAAGGGRRRRSNGTAANGAGAGA